MWGTPTDPEIPGPKNVPSPGGRLGWCGCSKETSPPPSFYLIKSMRRATVRLKYTRIHDRKGRTLLNGGITAIAHHLRQLGGNPSCIAVRHWAATLVLGNVYPWLCSKTSKDRTQNSDAAQRGSKPKGKLRRQHRVQSSARQSGWQHQEVSSLRTVQQRY